MFAEIASIALVLFLVVISRRKGVGFLVARICAFVLIALLGLQKILNIFHSTSWRLISIAAVVVLIVAFAIFSIRLECRKQRS
ncbi:hypothetical protein EFT87_05365 [Schleiferilactobacillus harbinensis]|jgi:hypothetical protein|nr:hypothetical protein [Schleiferilactobacillus harbinensis]